MRQVAFKVGESSVQLPVASAIGGQANATNASSAGQPVYAGGLDPIVACHDTVASALVSLFSLLTSCPFVPCITHIIHIPTNNTYTLSSHPCPLRSLPLTALAPKAAQMSNDEKLLASSLIKSLAPFDMSLAWALCAKVFNDDKVRWNCVYTVTETCYWFTHS